MKRYLLLMIFVFCVHPVVAKNNDIYNTYLEKIFVNDFNDKNHFAKQFLSKELVQWLEKTDAMLNTNTLPTYKASFVFSLDKFANLDGLQLLSDHEHDFLAFKKFVAEFMNIEFPRAHFDLTDFVFQLDGQSLYIFRLDANKVYKASIVKTKNNLQNKLANLNTNFTLYQPSFLDYVFLGQKIKFKNDQDLFFDCFVTDFTKTKINLRAYQVYDALAKKSIDFQFQLEQKKQKENFANYAAAMFASALKISLLDSYASYGIAPASLAVMGLTGEILLENDKEIAFSLEKGDKLNLKIKEEK